MREPTLQLCGERQASTMTGTLMYRDVAQLVARTAGGREVASSSLVIPTMHFPFPPYGGFFVILNLET